MKVKESLQNAFKGVEHSFSRYPLTILFLIIVTVLTAISIAEPNVNLTRWMMTSLIGVLISVVAQTLYERFGQNPSQRYLSFLATVILTMGYYFLAGSITDYDLDILIKTAVTLFALFIAFIWIPTIHNDGLPFHRNFLAVVKAFFTAVLFTIVLLIGISAIFNAVNYLLFTLNYDWLLHFLNPVYTLFGPLVFLSLIPKYQVIRNGHEESLLFERPFTVPRFFDVLLSYIIIPLIVIYTFILIFYVLTNITGEFWTNNLLEPLLVSYAILVIIVLILSYNLENRFARLFRKIFPKILVPIVVFQTIASILKIREMGMTHGRYYVILFGLFAIVAGLIFSFMKPKNHDYIAAVLLILATISIVPPVDAFSVSKNSQLTIFEETLIKNNLLNGETIHPNSDTPTADRITLTNSLTYLQDIGYTHELSFLPDDFERYRDFEEMFGFPLTYAENQEDSSFMGSQYVYVDREESSVIEISEYDVMLRQSFYHNIGQDHQHEEELTFELDGETYQFEQTLVDDYYKYVVRDESGEELIAYHTKDLFDDIFGDSSETEYKETILESEDATFKIENERATLKITLFSLERTPAYYNGEFDLFIDIK